MQHRFVSAVVCIGDIAKFDFTTRILNDDSIRKPRLLQFFKEYFDYGLAANICKDAKALKSGGGSSGTGHYSAMNSMIANTDRLIELILQEDQNVFKELLTTNRVIYNPSGDSIYFGNVDRKFVPAKQKKVVNKKLSKAERKKAAAKAKASSKKQVTKLSKDEQKEAAKKAKKQQKVAAAKAKVAAMKAIFPNPSKPVFVRQSHCSDRACLGVPIAWVCRVD